ncbi:MAG: sigma-54 dependent transcriptional regulator [Myxococcales bacterium]
MKYNLLVVEDDYVLRETMGQLLTMEGYEVRLASSISEALNVMGEAPPDVALVDHGLPDGTALDLLRALRQRGDSTPVLVITGTASYELAVEAMKAGAENFLTKPVQTDAMLALLRRVLEQRRAQRKLTASERSRAKASVDPFIGASRAIREVSELARAVLHSQAPVLITGETGTGKSVLARWLHENGRRAQAAYVDLNCAGLSKELAESELFGHRRGTFTGATTDKGGLLELAHEGTLFLDEVGDLDLTVQPKLLKVLEEKRYRRLGDVHVRDADVRLIAATHRDLPRMTAAGTFREDLLFRINTIIFELPPLRSRPEDIVPIARSLLANIGAEQGKPGIELSDAASQALTRYRWPGNVRELRNVLERALIFCRGDRLEVEALRFSPAFSPTSDPPQATGGDSLEDAERRCVVLALQESDGKVEAAARRLGIARSSLYAKLKRYGLSPS